MSDSKTPPKESIRLTQHDHVSVVELCRPPHNFFDHSILKELADCLDQLEADSNCRTVVLASEGTSFCAGADFSSSSASSIATHPKVVNPLYQQAIRLFSFSKPMVAAVQGPAIGGGLGLALVADFRIACQEARFSANFNRLGFHPGFGLSVTLPELIGVRQASLLFYTGRHIDGQEALKIGLVDSLVEQHDVRSTALKLAQEIAQSAPLAVQSTRTTLRQELIKRIRDAVVRETEEQYHHFSTADFQEGITAARDRRQPSFQGR